MTNIQFQDFQISDELKRAVQELGYETPTPIQQQSIPLILEGKDVTGQSQTGSGKTASFGLPALDKIQIDIAPNIPQVLILCPTRELAMQASSELKKFSKYKPDIRIVTIFGGDSYERQFSQLRSGCQIVVGTPGRVMDHMRRGTLNISRIRMLILDEADEMLNMGFREDIETILLDAPSQRQTILFSATMPPEILELSVKYQTEPHTVRIDNKQMTVSTLEQFYFETPRGRKSDAVVSLLSFSQPKRAIIFCNTKKMVDELVEELGTRGFPAQGLHGDMRQSQRTQVMNQYKAGKFAILVATDVAARGIDVNDVEIVLNYDLPQDEEYYVHRIGRTARAGKTGKSFTLIQGRGQLTQLRDIMRYTKSQIQPQILPSVDEIRQQQVQQKAKDLKHFMETEDFQKFIPVIEQLTSEAYTATEVAAALYAMQQGPEQDLAHLANLQVLPMESEVVKDRFPIRRSDVRTNSQGQVIRDRDRKVIREPGTAVIKISIGHNDRVSAAHILSAVAGGSGIPGKLIGAITIQKTYSLVDVPKEYRKSIIEKLNNTKIKGKTVKVL
jgi:ATP-dependent RNA helicase DeaD